MISGKHSTVLKGLSYGLKVRLQSFITSFFFFWLKELLASCPGVDTAKLVSSSDVGVKNLANSLTREGPI